MATDDYVPSQTEPDKNIFLQKATEVIDPLKRGFIAGADLADKYPFAGSAVEARPT